MGRVRRGQTTNLAIDCITLTLRSMSFLTDFLYFTRYHEAPKNFQFWSCLSALSALVGRRVWFDMGHFRYHCALYVVLVGPPGVRKSTSLDVACDIVTSVADIPRSADSTTAESLSKDMGERGRREFIDPTTNKPVEYYQMACFATEFAQFIGTADETMINLLTAIWGVKRYLYKTKHRGQDHIPNPYLTLMGAATPTWISSRLKSDVISGGMSRRTIFPYATKNALRNPLPQRTACEQEAMDRMLAYAQEVQRVAGPFTLDPDAQATYVEWYNNLEMPQEAYLQSWYNSKAEMIFKVAMLLSISESFDLHISKRHFDAALAALDEVEETLHYVLGNFGRNELKSVSTTMLLMLESAGGCMLEEELRIKMFPHYKDDSEHTRVVEHLLTAKMVYKMVKSKGTPQEAPVLATAAFYLAAAKRIEELREQNKKLDTAPPPTAGTSNPPPSSSEAPPASPDANSGS